jgi:S-adenosylmethionine hydrolase
VSDRGEISGRVIHIDRFGNCVTNITDSEPGAAQIEAGATLTLNNKVISSFRNFFAEGSQSTEEPFAVWGSAGFLEIAVANNSAAKILNVRRGDTVVVST